MNGTQHILSATDLTRVYKIGGRVIGSRLVAVNRASFEITQERPEILTLAGESGSGKTTLARMVLGLISPTSGTISYAGRNVTRFRNRKDRLWLMSHIQPVFQNPFESFNPLKKVTTYLDHTAKTYRGTRSPAETREVVDGVLHSIGLSIQEVEDRYPNEFSGGQLQRISIARALITQSRILVADEPVSMVDASIRMSIINLFAQLKETLGVSMIYITHDLATAYYLSDRIAIMFRGDMVELGPVQKVVLEPLHPYTKALIQSIPRSDPDKRWVEKVKLSTLEAREYSKIGCKFSDRCPWAQEVCRTIAPDERLVDERKVRCHRAEELAGAPLGPLTGKEGT
jgi:peptide/nickel transport system ATP-binding protein